MNTLWHKVWADLWLSKSRTVMAIISIAAGVFCVGTLYGMIALQLSKMDAAHQQSQPSHISLILRQAADANVLTQIQALEGVDAVDSMTQLTVSFKANQNADWQIATLMIRPQPNQQRFDKTSVQSGIWPAKGEVAIENLSAAFSGLKQGDLIELATDTGSQNLQISAVVRHPFVKPPKFGGQAHFFIDSSQAEQFGLSAQQFKQLLVQIKSPYDSDQARNVAEQIRTLLAKRAIDVNVTLLQDPQKHWGRPFLAGVNGVLQWMALVSLALACVLILNTVSAHIAQQSDQIGVMKALGASTFTIAKLYLLEILLMALLAIGLALAPSLAAAYFSSCKILGLFNIACGGFDYSPLAIQYMLLGGLLVPLLAALPPIWRGASITVREAIASYGLGSDFGRSRFDSLIETFGAHFLPTVYAAALGNLFRRKGRLLLTQSVLIIAGVMFLLLMSLIASLNLTLDNEMARSRYALRLGFTSDQAETKVKALAETINDTQAVEVWQRLPMSLAKNHQVLRQQGSLGAQLLALPVDGNLYQPLIESGRWLQASDAGQKVLVLSADTAQLNGIAVGDQLEMRLGATQQTWQVIGLYRWLAGTNYAVEPVYAPLDSVRQISKRGDLASFALLDAPINSLEQEADYLKQVKQVFADQAIKLDVYTTQAKLEQRQFARNQFQSVIGTLLGLASMIVAVGGIGLSGALAISVLQRRREIGVLRAIGASAAAIFRLFLLEGLLHGVMAWTLSIPIAYFAAQPVAAELGRTMLGIKLDYCFNYPAVAYWLLIMLIMAWLAAYWPAKKAAGMTVKDCLA